MYKKIIVLILVLVLALTSCTSDNNAVEEEKNKTVDSEIVASDENALYTQILSGIFYSNPLLIEDDEHIKLRIEAVEIYYNKALELYEACLQLSEDIYVYEENILEQLDTIVDEEALKNGIVQNMMVYDVKIDTALQEIKKYQSINNEMTDSVGRNMTFNKIIDAYDTIDQYITFLVLTNSSITSIHNNQALTEENQIFYETEMVPNYAQALNYYLALTDIYSYIASADYYSNRELISNIDLSVLDKNENVEDALEMSEAVLALGEPAYLIQPTVASVNNVGMITMPKLSTKKQSLADNILTATILLAYSQKKNGYVSEEQIQQIMELIIYESNPDPSTQNKLLDSIKEDNAIDRIYEGMVSGKEKIIEEITVTDKKIKPKVEALEIKKVSQEALDKVADKIFLIQNGLKLKNIWTGSDEMFTTITATFSSYLNQCEGKMKKDQYEQAQQLLEHELVALIGDQRETFVNKVLSANVEKLTQKFANWQANSMNSNTLNLDKETLIQLLEELGMTIENVLDLQNLNITRSSISEQELFTIKNTDSEYDIIKMFYGIDLNKSTFSTENDYSEVRRYVFTTEPYRAVIVRMRADEPEKIESMICCTTYENEEKREISTFNFFPGYLSIYQRIELYEDTVANKDTVLSMGFMSGFPVDAQYHISEKEDGSKYTSSFVDYQDEYIYEVNYYVNGDIGSELFYEYTERNKGVYNQKVYSYKDYPGLVYYEVGGYFTYEKRGFVIDFNVYRHGTAYKYDLKDGSVTTEKYVDGQYIETD